MLRNLLGVEEQNKSQGRGEGQLFASAEVTFNTGIILFVGEDLSSEFSPGQKIYFGAQREKIRMDGKDIMVMEEKNVFAVVED